VVQPPSADRTAELVQGILADRGRKRGERLPVSVASRAGAEGEPKEGERGVRMPTRRLASLQYTIRVLAGCSRSPTSAILSAIALTSMLAWRSLTQCTTASSAWRSNWMVGNLSAIHRSNA